MFAGLAALLAAGVVAGVIIIIKNKDGSETKIEAPDGATVTIKDKDGKTLAQVGPGIKPPVAVSDPDRQAAEYVFSLGGGVRVNGLDGDLKTAAELPKERFTLGWVELRGTKVTDAGLVALVISHATNSGQWVCWRQPLTLVPEMTPCVDADLAP